LFPQPETVVDILFKISNQKQSFSTVSLSFHPLAVEGNWSISSARWDSSGEQENNSSSIYFCKGMCVVESRSLLKYTDVFA